MNFARNIERKNEGMAWISRNRNTDLSTMGDVTGISQIEQGRGLDVVPSVSVRDRRAIGPIAARVRDRAVGRRVLQDHAAAQRLADGEHRLLGDRGRRPAGQPLAVQPVLPRAPRLLPAGRRHLPVRPAAAGWPAVLLAAARHQRGRPARAARRRRARSAAASAGSTSARWPSGRKRIETRRIRPRSIDATTALVGRVAANVLAESSVGMIVTSGDPTSNRDNSVAGVDFRYLNSQLIGGKSLEGDAWFQQVRHAGPRRRRHRVRPRRCSVPSNTGWRGEAGYTRIEENFYPALGFVRRTGVDDIDLEVGLHVAAARARAIRTIFSGLNVNAHRVPRRRVRNGEKLDVQSQNVNLQALNIDLNSQDGFGLSFSNSKEGLETPFMISRGVMIPGGHVLVRYAEPVDCARAISAPSAADSSSTTASSTTASASASRRSSAGGRARTSAPT